MFICHSKLGHPDIFTFYSEKLDFTHRHTHTHSISEGKGGRTTARTNISLSIHQRLSRHYCPYIKFTDTHRWLCDRAKVLGSSQTFLYRCHLSSLTSSQPTILVGRLMEGHKTRTLREPVYPLESLIIVMQRLHIFVREELE